MDGTDVEVGGFAVADVDDGDDSGRKTGRLIRPYAMTGGRTLAESEISLEAQIQATARASQHLGAYRWEAAKVVELVQSPMALIGSPPASRSRSAWPACSSPISSPMGQ